MRTVLKVSFCWFFLCLSALDCAAGETRTILILDATAQMSAQFGQQRKIDAMKSAAAAAAARMDAKAWLAAWAFGTNPSKKCEDRGELVHLQPVETAAGALDKALSPVQPRAARAPVFGTLQAALASLGEPKDGAVSAVIIAGTGDDCTGDICSEAKRLHDVYPNAKLTVLAPGMSEQAAANFTCAAKAMGGGFTAVKSAADLTRVLRQTLDIAPNAQPVKVPVQPSAAPAAPAEVAKTSAAKSTETAAAAPSLPAGMAPAVREQPQPDANTFLSFVLSSGMPSLEAGVTWEIYKINTTPTGQLRAAEAPSWTGGGGQAKLKLGEGRYLVRAAYGFASAEDAIAVGAGKVEKTISLNAGTIAAEALQAQGSQAAEDAFFVLYRRKTAVALEELGRSSEAPAIFYVNAGEYAIAATAGLAKLHTDVKVETGKVSAVRMALNVGVLEIKTFAVEGSSKPVPAWHRLYAAASGPGKAPVLRISGGSHRLQIPAGSYRLETEYGNARVESAVSVAAGQTASQSVVLGAGEAKISLPAGKPARVCAVYEAGADRNAGPLGRAAGTSMSFILKAGDYDVECRHQGESEPAKRARIRVVPGETQQAKIED
ncbi:MAG: hypothetical protein ACLP7P_10140 [Rhodomicrobium sp.]